MKRATKILNLISALIILIAGAYILVVFSSVLAVSVKLALGLSMVGHTGLHLDPYVRKSRSYSLISRYFAGK